MAERFFGSLKREWTSHCEYATRQEAKADIIAYIEMFYNSKRKHSYLGYVSPNDYEKFSLVASLCVLFPLTTSVPSQARLCQPEAGSGPGSPGQAPGTACCVVDGNGCGEAYPGR